MKYGLIGERLGHSYSKEIHEALGYEYELCEVSRERLDAFLSERAFTAINVTIPYKERVIPHLHYIDSHAKKIGAVNTVLNNDGRLYGYNTDFSGLSLLIERTGVSLSGKKVVILGTGGTSKTAHAVCEHLGAGEVITVSRSERADAVTYESLYKRHTDAEFLINTTPLGMYPDIFGTPADISRFPSLQGVIDAIYNPLRTPLILAARERGIPAQGGLYMLAAQAVAASELFFEKKYDKGITDEIYGRLKSKKENIVLIGMPASGKSTVGQILSERLGREFIDTDELVVKKSGMEIKEIFERFGEARFRELESEAVREASAKNSSVIATGGGAVLREKNVSALRENGRLFFIDRPLKCLVPTKSRPLSSDRASIEKRYFERYEIYRAAADECISADCDAEEVAEKIGKSI